MPRKPQRTKKTVATLTHSDASRKNIPTAEFQSVMRKDEQNPVRVAYERRNRDLDPQLVWRGKDEQDWSDLVVQAPPLYIQEKVHPKVLIDDLMRSGEWRVKSGERGIGELSTQLDLFADFNGLPDEARSADFYQHDANWTNRMILGDSLQVMASLAEREGLRGKVQCIYLDPPYGIKFNSNFQWSTTSRNVTDGKADHITREPEQVKAFRDTWRDGIHSYLTYLRDRLTVARDLLTESGSVFVQIGDENVHRVRALAEEVFGEDNFISLIVVWKTSSQTSAVLSTTCDYIVWFAKNREHLKYRQIFTGKDFGDTNSSAGEYKNFWVGFGEYLTDKQATEAEKQELKRFRPSPTTSQSGSETTRFPFSFHGAVFRPGPGGWKSNNVGFHRLAKADRIIAREKSVSYVRFLADFPVVPISELWTDVRWGFDASLKRYVVETNPRVVQRCILMSTDPGDLVLDPTCGAGTTAYVAEQWGRRWITIDTSRVALALARARIMGARYPYYLLADSREGRKKSGEWTVASGEQEKLTTHHSSLATNSIRQGFVYNRVPHITLKSIANNAEIDVIWEKFQETIEPLLKQLSEVVRRVESRKTHHSSLSTSHSLAEWEVPRDLPDAWPPEAAPLHEQFWTARVARQREIDASIAAKADFEYLYDKPYEDKKKVRVAGPFTVESLSPHRVLAVDEDDELIDGVAEPEAGYGEGPDFAGMILENLKTAGVQQAHKEDKITFTAITPWPGELICAEGRISGEWQVKSGEQGDGKLSTRHSPLTTENRVAIFIGPEFGTVSRPDLVQAAREAGDADFDALITCAFNYDARSSEFDKLGRIPVLKARMNADLHMADDLKNTGKGNLFVIFGEPDIDILDAENGQVRVKINGVDVFHPNTGEIRSDSADGIACWFIDTDYNEESFFVRHAYFLGANDPYKALRTTLKAEINADAWATLNSDTSRPFDKPQSGRIAVKVINHLGDEVMKVFRV